ncbi:MAG: hypothetical protein WAU28_02130 [Candidatus Moraniibacteriota bacterium]
MKKIVPAIGIIALLLLLEISWSGFFSFQERSYFFLFSFLALSVLRRGFLAALPMNIMTLVLFEGVTQSVIGSLSLYGVLFSYGMSFLLRRLHLEYGGEKIFLALVAGTGMALYPPVALWYAHSFRDFPFHLFLDWSFFQNILIGGVVFLIMLRFSSRFQQEPLPLGDAFLK